MSDDGLKYADVGHWAKRKYHFLERFLNMFTTAMKDKWEMHYVDLFAGAGKGRIKSTREVVDTSPLIAASLQHPFDYLHLVDIDTENINALRSRLSPLVSPEKIRIYEGDSNELVQTIASAIPQRGCLSVVMLDPFRLGHLPFETVKAISECRGDLIILLPDGMDAMRNTDAYYSCNEDSVLDAFLGHKEWRDHLTQLPGQEFLVRFREMYIEQLRQLGYEHFEWNAVEYRPGTLLYHLLFATRHPLGAKFWRNACHIDEGGQRGLFDP